MNRVKKSVSILLSLLMVLSLITAVPFTAGAVTTDKVVTSVTSGDYEYKLLDDGTAEITKYLVGKADSESIPDEGFIGNVELEIPSTIDGYAVTSIGSYAFKYFTSLTSVTIPDSVISIGYEAFCGCEGLTSITIPDSVISIDNDAFRGCTSLTSVTIPDSVTIIGDYAFYECTSLTGVTIPDSVTSIGEDAFRYCESLTSITIPNSVTRIGDLVFSGCESLKSITIPDSVTSIGYSAFEYCTSLTSVTIGNGVTRIGGDAFYQCKSLTSVTIGNGVKSIGDKAFYGCTSLTSVTIPDSVKSIGKRAFGYFYNSENNNYVKVDGFTIYGYTGTEAERYAKDNDFKFVKLDDNPIAKTTITLSKTSGSVYVKGTTQIKATVKNGKGTTTYSSSNKKVAKVSNKGKVTGLKKGTAKITVTNNGVKKTFKITVKNPKLSKNAVSVKKGKTTKVKIIGKIKGVNNKYTNTKIAKITSKKSASTLTVKGLKKGNTTLKIKVSGVTLKLKVKVK